MLNFGDDDDLEILTIPAVMWRKDGSQMKYKYLVVERASFDLEHGAKDKIFGDITFIETWQ